MTINSFHKTRLGKEKQADCRYEGRSRTLCTSSSEWRQDAPLIFFQTYSFQSNLHYGLLHKILSRNYQKFVFPCGKIRKIRIYAQQFTDIISQNRSKVKLTFLKKKSKIYINKMTYLMSEPMPLFFTAWFYISAKRFDRRFG